MEKSILSIDFYVFFLNFENYFNIVFYKNINLQILLIYFMNAIHHKNLKRKIYLNVPT